MSKQAQRAKTPLSGPGAGQTSGPQSQDTPAQQSCGTGSDNNEHHYSREFEDKKTTSGETYDQSEPVECRAGAKQAQPARTPPSGPGAGQTSGPPSQSLPVHQSGINGSDEHIYENSGEFKDRKPSDGVCEQAELVTRHAADTSAGDTDPGGASGRRVLLGSIRAHLSCVAAAIAVVLTLVAVGLALAFINKGDMSQLTLTVDALERHLENMSIAFDAMKRDHDISQNRTAVWEQRFLELSKTVACPEGYSRFRGTCYKAFNTRKTFSNSSAACREDGGTLAMPRDDEINAFLISLAKSVCAVCTYWIGLHDQREEGRFEWVDGSAPGKYNSWSPGEPDKWRGDQDCVYFSVPMAGEWADFRCDNRDGFICQVTPGEKQNPNHR